MSEKSNSGDQNPSKSSQIICTQGEDRLTYGTLEDLLSDQGLEIKQVENPVVVLQPTHWMLHQTVRTTLIPEANDPEMQALMDRDIGPVGFSSPDEDLNEFFESAEHVITVKGCKLKFRDNPEEKDAVTYKFHLQNGLTLTYGQIIALAGDFYGDPAKPVCKAGDQSQREAQFLKNFESLASRPEACAETERILEILKKEFQEIAKAIRDGKQPSAAYRRLGDELSKEWDKATSGRYLKLATTNFDHFGQDAILCYTAGHTLAQRHAMQAQNDTDLAKAYAINAFADHFLTDLFSAGHLRTPRRKMYEDEERVPGGIPWGDHYFTYKDLASLLARAMHDEDCQYGLWVTNQRGDRWVVFGDKRYGDRFNYPNRKVMHNALQQSMDEVWEAFNSKAVPHPGTSPVFSYLPDLGMNWKDRRNCWSPLFWLNPDDGKVWRRSDVAKRDDYTFQENWWVWTTALDLWRAGKIQLGFTSPKPGATGLEGTPPTGVTVSLTGPDLRGVMKDLSNWYTERGPSGLPR